MKLYWNTVAAYPVVRKNIYYCVRPLIVYSIHFRPFAEVIHHDENILISGIAYVKRVPFAIRSKAALELYCCNRSGLLLTIYWVQPATQTDIVC